MNVEVVLSTLALRVAQQRAAYLQALAVQHASSPLCGGPHPVPILSSAKSVLDLLRAGKLHCRVRKVPMVQVTVMVRSADDIAVAAATSALDTLSVMLAAMVMCMVRTVNKNARLCLLKSDVMGTVPVQLRMRA